MADTIRTIPEILALFADNTSGDISPQDLRDAMVTFEALIPTVSIHSAVTSQGIGSGNYYAAGFYDFPAADANLTQVSTTQVYGAANASYAAHASVVAAAAGTTDGSDLVLTVTGTSVDDNGNRTTGDSEIVVTDCTAAVTNEYFETVKKWLGPITYTLSSTAGTAFSFDFNYGFSAYEDHGNTDFTLDNFLFEWLGGANDSGFDIDIHHHKATGWTYHATAFDPGPAEIYRLSSDHSTDSELINGEYGRWKRTGLSIPIQGSASEGIVVHVTTTINNSLQWCNVGVQSKLTPI